MPHNDAPTGAGRDDKTFDISTKVIPMNNVTALEAKTPEKPPEKKPHISARFTFRADKRRPGISAEH